MHRADTLILMAMLVLSSSGTGAFAGEAGSVQPEPVVVGAAPGLEVRRVVVESAGGQVGLALGPYADRDTGVEPLVLERLRAAGFRLVLVPVDDVAAVLGSLRAIGSVQQEWLGQLHFWTPLVSGPMLDERVTRVDSGLVELDPGRMRLMARAWLVPRMVDALGEARVESALRVELLPQHEQEARRTFTSLVEPRARTFEHDGLVFRRLRLTVDLEPGFALVLVPDDPAADWTMREPAVPVANSTPEQADAASGPSGEASEGVSAPAVREPVPAAPAGSRTTGPEEPSPRTLGEQMLRTPTQATSLASGSVSLRRERSVVLVLIPHTPERYRLLP
jgi:hypothetical protein